VRPSHRAFPPSLAPRALSQRIAALTWGGTVAAWLGFSARRFDRTEHTVSHDTGASSSEKDGLTTSSGIDRLTSKEEHNHDGATG
jgi:hypothetical protein